MHICITALWYLVKFTFKLLIVFSLQQVHNFGDPFFLAINDNETLGEIKARIQKKLHVPDEEFSKVSDLFFEIF